MLTTLTRRKALKLASLLVPGKALRLLEPLRESESVRAIEGMPVSDQFPAHPTELVREMVTVAHFDLKRVKELCEARPALARAGWDWGFGDWETPLGAASHMGNRAIAEYLISRGARPSLFSAAMLGQLEVVRAFVAAQAGVQKIRGPHSISLLAHARMGGEAARPLMEFLQGLDGADSEVPVALADPEATELVGTYAFGVGVAQQIEVSLADKKMYPSNKMYTYAPQLHWTRTGTMTRPLFHLGGNTFCPAGAPDVRIHFAEEAEGVLMTVNDGEFAMTARKKR